MPVPTCPGCGKRINPNLVACAPCWAELPARIRGRVVSSWRRCFGKGFNENDPIKARAEAERYFLEHPRRV